MFTEHLIPILPRWIGDATRRALHALTVPYPMDWATALALPFLLPDHAYVVRADGLAGGAIRVDVDGNVQDVAVIDPVLMLREPNAFALVDSNLALLFNVELKTVAGDCAPAQGYAFPWDVMREQGSLLSISDHAVWSRCFWRVPGGTWTPHFVQPGGLFLLFVATTVECLYEPAVQPVVKVQIGQTWVNASRMMLWTPVDEMLLLLGIRRRRYSLCKALRICLARHVAHPAFGMMSELGEVDVQWLPDYVGINGSMLWFRNGLVRSQHKPLPYPQYSAVPACNFSYRRVSLPGLELGEEMS